MQLLPCLPIAPSLLVFPSPALPPPPSLSFSLSLSTPLEDKPHAVNESPEPMAWHVWKRNPFCVVWTVVDNKGSFLDPRRRR